MGIATADDILIEGNFIYGFADDPIGCHSVNKLTIAHNHCYSTDGRILFNNCTDVRVIGNYAERIPKPDNDWIGGGALMYAGIESPRNEAPSRIVISNNQLYLPADVPSGTYGIRLMGIRDAIVANNQIRCDSPEGGTAGIRIENDHTRPDWSDPTELDPEGVARPRNVQIIGNNCIGIYPQRIEQTGSDLLGPFYVYGNVAGGYLWFANTHFGLNNVAGAEPNPMKINGATALSSKLLFEAFCSGIAAGSTVTAIRTGGVITQYFIERPTRITYMDVVLDTPITGGAIVVLFLKNGTNVGRRVINSADGIHARIFWPHDDTFDYVTCATGDFIEFQLRGNPELESAREINAIINVNGISW